MSAVSKSSSSSWRPAGPGRGAVRRPRIRWARSVHPSLTSVESVALEGREAGDPRQLRHVQRSRPDAHEPGRELIAPVRSDDRIAVGVVPFQVSDLGVEQGVVVQAVLPDDPVAVRADLRGVCVPLRRHVPGHSRPRAVVKCRMLPTAGDRCSTLGPGGAMQIGGSVALVTGANRGLGRAYARELVRRGAAKVYGAARQPAQVTEPGVTPVALDITDPELVARVAAEGADRTLLVNNAGVMRASTFIGAPSLDAAWAEMGTNYFGTLRMCRAFAPVLAANGGGAIVNMLSITSFYTNPFNPSYGPSKAAEWSLTNAARLDLHHQGTPAVPDHS